MNTTGGNKSLADTTAGSSWVSQVSLGGEWSTKDPKPWTDDLGQPLAKPKVDVPARVATVAARRDSSSKDEPTAQYSATKSRTMETWIDRSLKESLRQRTDADMSDASETNNNQLKERDTGKNKSLTHFGIDCASLERLGVDHKTSEHVHRAFFVYSQGIHSVLQDAVKHSTDKSQALLVLWKALSAILESTQEGNDNGGESIAAIIQKGNEEEAARVKEEFNDQIDKLQRQLQNVLRDKEKGELELKMIQDENEKCRNDLEMEQKERDILEKKYELEIRKRMGAELAHVDRNKWVDVLQEHLEKEKQVVRQSSEQYREAKKAENDLINQMGDLRSQVRSHEVELSNYANQSLEAVQQQAHFDSVMASSKEKIKRYKDEKKAQQKTIESQLQDIARYSQHLEQLQRHASHVEAQLEDEVHYKQDLQTQKDNLAQRSDSMQKELEEFMDSKRSMQKQISDYRIQNRTQELEIKRVKEEYEVKKELAARLEEQYTALKTEYRLKVVQYNELESELENVAKQLKMETKLRKELSNERRDLSQRLEVVQKEFDAALAGNAKMKQELLNTTKKNVTVETSETSLRKAMNQQGLGHSVEMKALTQGKVVLEKALHDERQISRQNVAELRQIDNQRQDMLNAMGQKETAVILLKNRCADLELEVERLEIAVIASKEETQEFRQMTDKQYATVANFDSELRQAQVILEAERTEHKAMLVELTESFHVARAGLEREIEGWKFRFEDALSLLHFNPMNDQIVISESKIQGLNEDLKGASKEITRTAELVKKLTADLEEEINQKKALEKANSKLKREKADLKVELAEAIQSFDQRAMQLADNEERTIMNSDSVNQAADEKRRLEGIIRDLKAEIKRLIALMNKPKADACSQTADEKKTMGMQTDLSYQYLESTAGELHEGIRQREKLDVMKKASAFVDDFHEQRDFKAAYRSSSHAGADTVSFSPEDSRMSTSTRPSILYRPRATLSGGAMLASITEAPPHVLLGQHLAMTTITEADAGHGPGSARMSKRQTARDPGSLSDRTSRPAAELPQITSSMHPPSRKSRDSRVSRKSERVLGSRKLEPLKGWAE